MCELCKSLIKELEVKKAEDTNDKIYPDCYDDIIYKLYVGTEKRAERN